MAGQEHTIGVADDEPGLRQALARLLRSHGYVPEVFESAAEVMRAATTSKAACLLLDLQFGETSGLDLARQLHEAGVALPIIFMSASDDDVLRQECIDFGCAGYLRKPFFEQQLLDAIVQAIEADPRRR
jgi:FixJ family two-component response regulator